MAVHHVSAHVAIPLAYLNICNGRTYSIRVYACIGLCVHVRDVYTSPSLSSDTTFCNDDISYLPQCLGPFLHHLWVRLGMMYCNHSPQSISHAVVRTGII